MPYAVIPFRLCCGEQHYGPVCNDGKVMCCHCFDRVERDKLASDGESLIDVCQECWNVEQEQLKGN